MKETPFATNTLQAISQLVENGPAGNRWFKVNLHAHARGHTPADIVKHARLAEIDLLAITDHQTFEQCNAVIAAAKTAGRPLTVLAGIEITAHEGVHVIALFPPSFSKMDQDHFIGWLNISGTGDTRSASPQKVMDIFAQVHQADSVIVIPHPFNDTDALTSLDILENQIAKERRFSRSRLSDHIDVVSPIGTSKTEGFAPSPNISCSCLYDVIAHLLN